MYSDNMKQPSLAKIHLQYGTMHKHSDYYAYIISIIIIMQLLTRHMLV